MCTVPAVRSELRAGAGSHPHLQRALDSVGDTTPVGAPPGPAEDAATQRERRLDPGDARAVTVVNARDGTPVIDDGPACGPPRETGVTVTGSIGVLISGVDDERLSEVNADRRAQGVGRRDGPPASVP
jgi:hypothetical protein